MAVHLLCALAWNEGRLIGSEDLAYSVGTHPSFLRGLIVKLREAGLVETRQGKGGGPQHGAFAEQGERADRGHPGGRAETNDRRRPGGGLHHLAVFFWTKLSSIR